MIIVKFGGSLYSTPELTHWLTTLRRHSQHQNIIIVPGGGPFADQVRKAQSTHGFDDHHAHHMAILAMAQFGILLSGLLPESQPFSSPSETTTLNHPLMVWLPDKQLLEKIDLAQSWDITSDSLALWLAQKCSANKLSLIKTNPPQHTTSINKLHEMGFLDNAFSTLASQQSIPIEVIAANSYQHFTLDIPLAPLR